MSIFNNKYVSDCETIKKNLLERLEVLESHLDLIRDKKIEVIRNFDYEYSLTLLHAIDFGIEIFIDLETGWIIPGKNAKNYIGKDNFQNILKSLRKKRFLIHHLRENNKQGFDEYVHIDEFQVLLPEICDDVKRLYNVSIKPEDYTLLRELELYSDFRKSSFPLEMLPMFGAAKVESYISHFYEDNIHPIEQEISKKLLSLFNEIVRQWIKHRFDERVQNRISDEFVDLIVKRTGYCKVFSSKNVVAYFDGNPEHYCDYQNLDNYAFLSCYLLANPNFVLTPTILNTPSEFNTKWWYYPSTLYSGCQIDKKTGREEPIRLSFYDIFEKNEFKNAKNLMFSPELFQNSTLNVEYSKKINAFVRDNNSPIELECKSYNEKLQKEKGINRKNNCIREIWDNGINAVNSGLHVYYLEYYVDGYSKVCAECIVADTLSCAMNEIRNSRIEDVEFVYKEIVDKEFKEQDIF